MRIEKEKARERQESTQFGSETVGENFPAPSGRAKDKTAAAFGISGKQMEREMQIVEHKDLLDPADFADWDNLLMNIEISENDVRKAFSKSERVDYMYRLMRIEKEKAKERMSEGGKGAVKSSDVGEAKEKVAESFGIGRQTMEREMSIVEHKELLDPKDFGKQGGNN